MRIIKEYVQDGYKFEEYENGAIVKSIHIQHIDENENIEKQNEYVSKQDIINAQILNKLEYIECLQELNAMRG